MKKILVSMMMLMAISVAHAQVANDEFTKEINRTIELSNTAKNFRETMTQQMHTLVDQGHFQADNLDAMVKEIEAYALPLMEKKLIDIYREHFTLEEIKQINAYLSSPVGRKATSLVPKLAAEGMKVMQNPEAQQKIQEILLRYVKK